MSTAVSPAGERAAVIEEFKAATGLGRIDFEVKERSESEVLVVRIAQPSERFFGILNRIGERHPSVIATLEKRAGPGKRLEAPETLLLQRKLAESLNVNSRSFKDDFFARYTRSVSGAEAQITAAANHIVYGRRGAGKSSLLLYALRTRELTDERSAWIDMQAYQGMSEGTVVPELVARILEGLVGPDSAALVADLRAASNQPVLNTVENLLLDARRMLEASTAANGEGFVFLDDFHILDPRIQPVVLGRLYSLVRGAGVYLKLSAIESLTRTWDASRHVGLEIPQDASPIQLDLNLTAPDQALRHIRGILDAHAEYCGLESIVWLCVSEAVLTRLMWVSAGVPRDALSNFAQAMARDRAKGRDQVTVTSVNESASALLAEKEKDLSADIAGAEGRSRTRLRLVLDYLKRQCLGENRVNAFLVEIKDNAPGYRAIRELVDLRMLHVISDGISIGKVGKRHKALILDYGFYVGLRRAQSVEIFNPKAEPVRYSDLRKLPRIDPAEALKDDGPAF